MSQLVGTWDVWWGNSTGGIVSQTTLSIVMKDDGDLAGNFGSSGDPGINSFTGSPGDDVIGGEILSGVSRSGLLQNGFTFMILPQQANFLTGALVTSEFGADAPIPVFGVRRAS